MTEEDPECLAEQVAWEKYQNASQEARMMVRLNHENVLRLIGITLTPMRLLLELAPLGDLKTSVERFKSANTRFNRKTLKAIMTQASSNLQLNAWRHISRAPNVFPYALHNRLLGHCTTSIPIPSSTKTSSQETFSSGSSPNQRHSGTPKVLFTSSSPTMASASWTPPRG